MFFLWSFGLPQVSLPLKFKLRLFYLEKSSTTLQAGALRSSILELRNLELRQYVRHKKPLFKRKIIGFHGVCFTRWDTKKFL